MLVELTKEDQQNLLGCINNSSIKGSDSELISNLKKKILIPYVELKKEPANAGSDKK